MQTTIRKFVNKNLPKRRQPHSGHRITFIARDAKKNKWSVNVQNDNPAVAQRAIAVKQGTKGATDTTRKEFRYTETDNGFVVDSEADFKLTKL